MEDEDYRPPRRRKRRDYSMWIAFGLVGIVAGVAALVLTSVARQQGTKGDADVRGKPAKSCKVGDTVSFGDVSVKVLSVKVQPFTSHTSAGNAVQHDTAMLVRLRIKNWNPNRVAEIRGQARRAVVKDNVGNRFEALTPVLPVGSLHMPTEMDDHIRPGYVVDLRSDTVAHDTAIFPRPVPGASSATVSLAAECYGAAEGWLDLHTSRAEWGN